MSRLVVVSNRIPTGENPSGGLVVALHDCLSKRGGIWIGSSGEVTESGSELREIGRRGDTYQRFAYDLSEAEHRDFYLGYANSVLWPLFHHRPDLIDLKPEFAEGYRAMNARVAKMLVGVLQTSDVLWVQDYHFLPLASELRAQGFSGRIGFFLHIPFPTSANMPALPEARELTGWIAAYDLFGVQTRRDVAACLEVMRWAGDVEMLSSGLLKRGERQVMLESFPIGIDAEGYARTAVEMADSAPFRKAEDIRLVLGVDRLDYSKGLVNRFEGFNAYLDARAGDQPRATLLQIAPPSREDVEAYQDIRRELEGLSGSINGSHADLDWTPIRYIRRPVEREKLAALYRAADVGLVTPLADGMNLVAKEFVAAQDPEDPGVLILSHFAGAVEQLSEALAVNPYDAIEMSEVIAQALTMPLAERKERHAALWANVRDQNVGWWTERFLRRLSPKVPQLA